MISSSKIAPGRFIHDQGLHSMEDHMRHLLVLLPLLCCPDTSAQWAVTSSGGDAGSAEGSVAWSMGQVGHTAPASAQGSVSQGVQQAYTVITVSTTEATDPAMAATVGPNPTMGGVLLELAGTPPPNARYQLLSATGQVLQEAQLTDQRTSIAMEQLPAASYLLSLMEDGLPVLVVRIIKQ